MSDLFNACYRFLYLSLAEIYSPGSNQKALVDWIYALMAGAMSPISRFLVGSPLDNGTVAAPTFELYRFESTEPLAELRALADSAVDTNEDLAPIRDLLAEL